MTSISATQPQAKINANVSNIENVLNRNSKMFGNMLTTINLIDNITKTINRVEEKLNGSINRVEEIFENITKTINRMDEKFQNTNEIRSEENKSSDVVNIEDFEEFPSDEVEEVVSNVQPNVTVSLNSNYQCNIDGCFKKFQNETKLKIHMRRCGVEKKFKCHIEGCCKAFKTKSELEIHFDSHSNEKKYSCDLCESKYKQKSTLSTHKKTHTGQRTLISISIGLL